MINQRRFVQCSSLLPRVAARWNGTHRRSVRKKMSETSTSARISFEPFTQAYSTQTRTTRLDRFPLETCGTQFQGNRCANIKANDVRMQSLVVAMQPGWTDIAWFHRTLHWSSGIPFIWARKALKFYRLDAHSVELANNQSVRASSALRTFIHSLPRMAEGRDCLV